jgi:MFS family permease
MGILTNIPGRLDRLPWSGWHWKILTGLGITWILDGLEVTIVGSVGAVLSERDTLHLSETQIGAAGSAYLAGAVLGALVFGRLTDRLGRKKLFFVTLGVYLISTLLSALSWSFMSFAFFRALTGAGIGGEYSAIGSAIDEIIPARVRGRVNLGINSTYWLGTALGALISLPLLNPHLLPHSIGWRLCFGSGAILGLFVIVLRRYLPESPRWLIHHGREAEAEKITSEIENAVSQSIRGELPPAPLPVWIEPRGSHASFRGIAHTLFIEHPKRAFLGLSLMVAQAFAYNAVFFTYALVLGKFYGVPSGRIGYYLLPFAAGNFLGPILLGPFFDTIGRKTMIASTYALAGVLLAGTGYAFAQGWLTANSQTFLWCAVFFVASAAASSCYLTVGELFPIEMRAMSIAFFYAIGTAVGGIGAPALLGSLIQTGDRGRVSEGYYLGAALLMLGALAAVFFAVPAEGMSLEELTDQP